MGHALPAGLVPPPVGLVPFPVGLVRFPRAYAASCWGVPPPVGACRLPRGPMPTLIECAFEKSAMIGPWQLTCRPAGLLECTHRAAKTSSGPRRPGCLMWFRPTIACMGCCAGTRWRSPRWPPITPRRAWRARARDTGTRAPRWAAPSRRMRSRRCSPLTGPRGAGWWPPLRRWTSWPGRYAAKFSPRNSRTLRSTAPGGPRRTPRRSDRQPSDRCRNSQQRNPQLGSQQRNNRQPGGRRPSSPPSRERQGGRGKRGRYRRRGRGATAVPPPGRPSATSTRRQANREHQGKRRPRPWPSGLVAHQPGRHAWWRPACQRPALKNRLPRFSEDARELARAGSIRCP